MSHPTGNKPLNNVYLGTTPECLLLPRRHTKTFHVT